jgi:hypothetical protein
MWLFLSAKPYRLQVRALKESVAQLQACVEEFRGHASLLRTLPCQGYSLRESIHILMYPERTDSLAAAIGRVAVAVLPIMRGMIQAFDVVLQLNGPRSGSRDIGLGVTDACQLVNQFLRLLEGRNVMTTCGGPTFELKARQIVWSQLVSQADLNTVCTLPGVLRTIAVARTLWQHEEGCNPRDVSLQSRLEEETQACRSPMGVQATGSARCGAAAACDDL